MGVCYINVQFFAINCCKLFLTALNYTQPTNFVLVALKGEHMKTTIEMAREAAGDDWGLFQEYMPEIHRFEELVRADERARMAEQPAQQEPVAYWIPKAEQFCIADPNGRPFAKAWEPLYTSPPAQQEPVA